MELSVVIARILALTYLGAGIAALTGRIKFAQMVEEFERSSALTYVTGFFTLVCGVLLVSYHSIWDGSWRVLISIVGWLSLLKGFLLISFPQYIGYFRGWYKDTKGWAVLMIALGLVFGYFGIR